MTEQTQETQSQQPPETGDGKDWKAEAEKWKNLSRENEQRAKTNAVAAKRLEEIEQANASELEKAVHKARSEGAAEVTEAANRRLVAAEARALAAEVKFRNPKLVIKALDLSAVKVADDGSIDDGAIRTLLAELAKEEPYLVDDGKVRPKPDTAQGRPPGTPSKAEEGRAEARKRFGTPAGQTTN